MAIDNAEALRIAQAYLDLNYPGYAPSDSVLTDALHLVDGEVKTRPEWWVFVELPELSGKYYLGNAFLVIHIMPGDGMIISVNKRFSHGKARNEDQSL
jgi:hypothetical protein